MKKLLKKLKTVKDETIKNLKEEFKNEHDLLASRIFSGINTSHLVIDVNKDLIKLDDGEIIISIKKRGGIVKIKSDSDKVVVFYS